MTRHNNYNLFCVGFVYIPPRKLDSSLDQATKLYFSLVKAINKVADFPKHLVASSKFYLFCTAGEVYICHQPCAVVKIIFSRSAIVRLSV